jgi:hypothetical protein
MNVLTKDFKNKLNQLQDDVDSKEAQIVILESEMQDAITPSNLIIDIKSTLMDMMFEIVVFEKGKGKSEKSTASKKRIEGLLESIDKLNGIASMNYNLKGANRSIHAKYQALRVENSELKAELKRIDDAEQFLAGD